MSIEALKERARRHEQREEWREALDLYRQAIARHDDQDQPDIALFNRVGDLQTRLGHVDQAAEAYERAVDLYLESELPNNAIAVCKKMARHLPGRAAVYLRMGQIRAGQGFLVDARQNFLVYAERMQTLGDIDEAFRALIEFADLAPEDTDIRLAIAAQMQQRDRREEALEQLAIGYRTLRRRGHDEGAETFREKILELDPEADVQALGEETAPVPDGDGFGEFPEPSEATDGFAEIELGSSGFGDAGDVSAPEKATVEVPSDEEFKLVARYDGDDLPSAKEKVEGFEATALGGLPEPEDEGFTEIDFAVDGDDEPEPTPLPLLESAHIRQLRFLLRLGVE